MFGEFVSKVFNDKEVSSDTVMSGLSGFTSQESTRAVEEIVASLTNTIQFLFKEWKRTLVGTVVVGASLISFYKFVRKKKEVVDKRTVAFLDKLRKQFVDRVFGMYSLVSDVARSGYVRRVIEKLASVDSDHQFVEILSGVDLPSSVKDYLHQTGPKGAKELLGLSREYKKAKLSSAGFYKRLYLITKVILMLFVAVIVFTLMFPLLRKAIKNREVRVEESNIYGITWVTESLLLERSTIAINSVVIRVWESLRRRNVGFLDKVGKMKVSTLVVVGIGLALFAGLVIVLRRAKMDGSSYVDFVKERLWKKIAANMRSYSLLLVGVVCFMSLFYWLGKKV